MGFSDDLAAMGREWDEAATASLSDQSRALAARAGAAETVASNLTELREFLRSRQIRPLDVIVQVVEQADYSTRWKKRTPVAETHASIIEHGWRLRGTGVLSTTGKLYSTELYDDPVVVTSDLYQSWAEPRPSVKVGDQAYLAKVYTVKKLDAMPYDTASIVPIFDLADYLRADLKKQSFAQIPIPEVFRASKNAVVSLGVTSESQILNVKMHPGAGSDPATCHIVLWDTQLKVSIKHLISVEAESRLKR